jgi:short chain dehydrogenase
MTAASEPEKVAIVTGASRGIGAGLTKTFVRAGYAVVATSRSIPTSTEPNGDRPAAQSTGLPSEDRPLRDLLCFPVREVDGEVHKRRVAQVHPGVVPDRDSDYSLPACDPRDGGDAVESDSPAENGRVWVGLERRNDGWDPLG